MALWPSEKPSDPNALRACREYWIEGAPTPRKHGTAPRWWAVGVVVFLGLSAGVVYFWRTHPSQVASLAATVEPTNVSAPEHTLVAAPSTPALPKLVVGLRSIGEPPERQGMDHAQTPSPTPEPHYAVGLRPITEQASPPPDPVAAAPPVAPPAPVKPSWKRAPPGPTAPPTSGSGTRTQTVRGFVRHRERGRWLVVPDKV